MRNRQHQPSRPHKKPPEPADIAAELNDLLSLDHIKPSLNWLIGPPPPTQADETTGDVFTPDVPSPQTAHNRADKTSPDGTSPDRAAPQISARPTVAAPSPVPASGDVISPVETSPDETTALLTSPVVLSQVRKVHRCSSVQDGHSSTEQLVYDLMWRAGRPVDPDVRLFQLPLEALAWKVRIAERNLRPLLKRLVQKCSVRKISEPDRGRKIPAAYHVYSYRRILALRKEAGLEYVVRSKGVEFIGREEALALEARRAAARDRLFEGGDPDISSPVDTSPDNPTDDTLTPLHLETSTHAPSPLLLETSPDVSGITSPDGTAPVTLLGHVSSGHPAAAAALPLVPPELCRDLRTVAGSAFTDAAAGRLWRECRLRAPDCAPAEILHFTRLKIGSIRNLADVANPVGLLLTAVPEFFEGGTLHEYRQQKSREEQAARRLEEENRRYYEEIIADPQASPEDRAWARSMLETLPG